MPANVDVDINVLSRVVFQGVQQQPRRLASSPLPVDRCHVFSEFLFTTLMRQSSLLQQDDNALSLAFNNIVKA